jgi:signal transduction histidine kinase
MRSIGARIAVWYACAATVTLACLFVAGYQFLKSHLIHGLDLLNETEYHQIEAHLGPDYATMSTPFIELRVREMADFAYALFYVEMHVPNKGTVFRSSNLNGHDIPDLDLRQPFIAEIDEIGELRAMEFSKPPFEIVVATPMRPVRELMSSYVRGAVGLIVLMLILSLAIGLGFSRIVLRPVRAIRDTANRIRSDNLSERIPVGAVGDEIADLARLLNQMFDRLETSFAQIRRFTADASHELKTPLSVIMLHGEKMLNDPTLSAAHRDAMQVQLEEVARLNRIIEELLLLSRADANALEIELSAQDPQRFLAAFTPDARELVEHHGLVFRHVHDGQGCVAFAQNWMRQVLFNLITNAIHVSPPGGTITMRSLLEGIVWRISVEDQGPGLKADQLERMFERFMRMPTPGVDYEGSGLGLAICRSIVDLHGGRIHAVEAPGGRGLCVIVEIPAVGA